MTYPTEDEGTRQIEKLGNQGIIQMPRGYNRVTIHVDVWASIGPHADTTWAVAENVEISMRQACERVAREITCEESGVTVVVK
jgi:hypothetical protein